MASIPPKANDALHKQSEPQPTTETHISSASSLNHHDNVEKIDRIPSYERPAVANDTVRGDVETTDVKYGTGIEEKAMSASEEDGSMGETKRQSKLRSLWIRYRIFGHLAIWLVMTAYVVFARPSALLARIFLTKYMQMVDYWSSFTPKGPRMADSLPPVPCYHHSIDHLPRINQIHHQANCSRLEKGCSRSSGPDSTKLEDAYCWSRNRCSFHYRSICQ